MANVAEEIGGSMVIKNPPERVGIHINQLLYCFIYIFPKKTNCFIFISHFMQLINRSALLYKKAAERHTITDRLAFSSMP